MNDHQVRELLDAVPDGGSLALADLRAGVSTRIRRRHHRRAVAVMTGAGTVLVVVLLLGAGIQARTQPVRIDTGGGRAPLSSPAGGTQPPGSEAPAGSEGYVNPERAPLYHQWLSEYDPADIAYLRAEWADASDLDLVTTLEFRRACRVTQQTWLHSTTLAGTERQLTIHRAMDPEIDLLQTRKPSDKDQSASFFEHIRDRMVAGDMAYMTGIFDHDCADTLRFDATRAGEPGTSGPR